MQAHSTQPRLLKHQDWWPLPRGSCRLLSHCKPQPQLLNQPPHLLIGQAPAAAAWLLHQLLLAPLVVHQLLLLQAALQVLLLLLRPRSQRWSRTRWRLPLLRNGNLLHSG